MNQVVENLKLAKALIADPADWIQQDYALDAYGNDVSGDEEGAVCFCSLGAIQKVCDTYLEWELEEAKLLNKAAQSFGYNSAAQYNDEHTHAEVMAMWALAIRMAEESTN